MNETWPQREASPFLPYSLWFWWHFARSWSSCSSSLAWSHLQKDGVIFKSQNKKANKAFPNKALFFLPVSLFFFPYLTAFSSIPCSYMSYNWLAQPTARRTDSSAFSPKSMPLASITPYRTNEIRVMTEDAHKTSKPTAIVILITRFLKQQDLHSLWPHIYSFPPPFPELPRFTSLQTSKRENVLYCTKVCDWANVNIVVQFVFHSLLNHSFFTIFCFFYCKTYASFSSEAQTHLAHMGPGSSA